MNAADSRTVRLGVELEYMIVDRGTLDVRPVADRLIHGASRRPKNEISYGDLRLSNELVLHVLELKTDGPVSSLHGLGPRFQEAVRRLNDALEPLGCRLLPSGMHPWMNPTEETLLWPHGDRQIYETFDRIFGCSGHGWSNLQSTHLNIGFSDDAQFTALHDAIRLLLPLVPALAASSPFREGVATGFLDTRLVEYRRNCARIPSITGAVVPEPVESVGDYQTRILEQIYRDLEPHDPEHVLRHEWANARGAIARFDRGAIEIRVMDVQEHPGVDVALLHFFVQILELLIENRTGVGKTSPCCQHELTELFDRAVQEGLSARVDSAGYLQSFGATGHGVETLGDLASWLCQRFGSSVGDDVRLILRHGPLAERLVRAAGPEPGREALRNLYRELADCLEQSRFFQS